MSVEAGKTRLALKNAARAILRLRFTVLFLCVMLIVNLLAGSLGNDLPDEILTDWGIGHDSLLFFGPDITTTLMLLLGLTSGAGIIDLTALNDVGMSMGGFGLIALVSGFALGNFMPRLAKDRLERGKRCAKKAI